jgi:hypothetical protein
MINKATLNSYKEQLKVYFLRFMATPASPAPLAVLRMGVAGVMLLLTIMISGSILDLYGQHGIVEWSTLDPGDGPSIVSWGRPQISWLVQLLGPLGVSSAACVKGVFYTHALSLAFLLIGFRTRTSAIIAFATQVLLSNSGDATIYGVDQFARVALFYCTWMPVGAAFSVDNLLSGKKLTASIAARVGLRVLQLQMAIMYLASGIEKASGEQWWNGEVIWRAVNLPELAQFDMTWLANHPWLALMIGLGSLVLELGYILLVWNRYTRLPVVLAAISMHIGIGILMGLHSFSALMIVLNVSAFLVAATPKENALSVAAEQSLPKPLPQSC